MTKAELYHKIDLLDGWVKKYKEKIEDLHYKIRLHDAGLRKKDRHCAREVAKRDAEIAELKAKLAARSNKAKQERFQKKKANRERREMEHELQNFQNEIQHLSKDLDWDKTTSRQQHIEIMLRTIISYNKLIRNGTITFNEFAFLLIGSQKEYFTIEDLKDRYGEMGGRVKMNIEICIEAGYLKKVERKPCWYVTLKGKKRLNDILHHIYTEKVTTYRIIKKAAIQEIEDESE